MLQREWQASGWKDDEKTVHADPPVPPTLPTLAPMPAPPPPVPPVPPAPPAGLGNISEQKGILGPGPAELRFSEAL